MFPYCKQIQDDGRRMSCTVKTNSEGKESQVPILADKESAVICKVVI